MADKFPSFDAFLEHWSELVNKEYGVYDEWDELWNAWVKLAYDKDIRTDEEMLAEIRSYEGEALEMMRIQKL